jgi:outer membrane protein TolC
MGIRFGLVLSFLFAAPAAFALQPLEVFVAAAGQHNPDALESQANLELQRAQADVALGRVLPGVAARGSITRNQYDSYVDLGPGQRVTVVPLHQRDGSVTLTVPLIDVAGFQRVAAARTSAKAADGQLSATRLQVEGQVAQDYYQVVANLALASASQKALEVSKESLRLAQNRVDAGAAPQLDLDRARADVEQQNQQVSGASLQVALAARALESASGIAPQAAAAPPLDDDLHPEAALAEFEGGVDRLPAVAAAAENTRAAEQQADAQRFTFLPSISGTFAERGTSAPGFTGHNWTWQAVLGFNWALDFTTPANVRVQDATTSGARARELRVRLAARDAIHRQWETVDASIARSRSARAGRSAANRASDSARDRYQAGAITQLELLQAQRDAFTAEVSRIQADADLVNARAQLRLATGTSLLHPTGTVQ